MTLPTRPWRFWLIDLPARITDLWFGLYWFILTVMAVGLAVTFTVSMVLAHFGVRWGW